jgi:hypothetical protein
MLMVLLSSSTTLADKKNGFCFQAKPVWVVERAIQATSIKIERRHLKLSTSPTGIEYNLREYACQVERRRLVGCASRFWVPPRAGLDLSGFWKLSGLGPGHPKF